MNAKQKEKVINEMLQVLSTNNVTYEEVPDLVDELRKELKIMCTQQVIKVS